MTSEKRLGQASVVCDFMSTMTSVQAASVRQLLAGVARVGSWT